MNVSDAQRDVRTAYLGGFPGQLVSGLLWLTSTALSKWSSHRLGILVLVVGGMAIFPLTLLVLRALGRPAGLPKGHPMNALGMQLAFTVPLLLPLVGAATLHRENWFYPACMLVVGAHYLPFVFLYGMRMFAVLAAILIGASVAVVMYVPNCFTIAGWITGGTLLVFAFLGRALAAREKALDP